MSFAGYFLSVLFCLLSMLISDSRFDLVWFRLSCDHGWIRSGSVNVRKQQQLPASYFSENLVEKIKIFVQDFVPIRTALRGGGDSFLFIYFIFLPVVLVLFLYSIFCLCPSFRVWSDRLYFVLGVFLP